MRLNEGAVFKWVLIVGAAAATVIAVTLLTSQLVGALWFLVLVIAGCVYGWRWADRRRRQMRAGE